MRPCCTPTRWTWRTSSSPSSSRPEGRLTWPDFVHKPHLLWMVYQQAKAWHCRPSEVLYLSDDWMMMFSVDQAVWTFGSALENALEEAAASAKKESGKERARQKVIRQWLPGLESSKNQRFRDPGQEASGGDTIRRV